MKPIYRFNFIAISASLVLLLSACGGGGGGGGGSTDNNNAPQAVLTEITESNYEAVAAEALNADPGTAIESSEAGMVFGVEVDSKPPQTLAKTSIDLFKRFHSTNPNPNLVSGVTASQNCDSGSITVSQNTRNESTLSVGDKVSVTYNNCQFAGLPLINGFMSITVASLTGDFLNSSTYSVGLSTVYKEFSIALGTDKMTVNGDTLITASSAPPTLSLGMSGSSLRVDYSENNVVTDTQLFTAYNFTSVFTDSSSTDEADFSFAGSSPQLGNYSYKMETTDAFFTDYFNNYPSNGTAVVYGKGSTVKITVVENGNVRLDYSAAGDGVITKTSTVSWASLETVN